MDNFAIVCKLFQVMNDDSIKENIIKKRTEAGLSQDEMARRLDISRNSYRSIEKGTSRLISKRLSKIAENLHTTEEELVLGYKPVRVEPKLEDVETQFLAQIDDLKGGYEVQVEALRNQIESLTQTIADLRETISSKNEIIALLKQGK